MVISAWPELGWPAQPGLELGRVFRALFRAVLVLIQFLALFATQFAVYLFFVKCIVGSGFGTWGPGHFGRCRVGFYPFGNIPQQESPSFQVHLLTWKLIL